jgi:hypothetical protein
MSARRLRRNRFISVLIEVGNSVQILLDYEGHFFRGDSDLHMAAARIIVEL